MKPSITRLVEEHEMILNVLASLEHSVGRPADLWPYVEFFSSYVDAHHHEKEEAILFEAMSQHGFSFEGGPLACMMHEHDAGRELVQALRAAASKETWSAAFRAHAHETMRAFAELLRLHIHKENQVLYPMAIKHLPAETMLEVDRRCTAVDACWTERERWEYLGRWLAARSTGPSDQDDERVVGEVVLSGR